MWQWGFSKVHPDRTKAREMLKYWGNCNKNCHGESFEPSNIHNLANEDFNEFWESDIFDLRTYDNGYCHTYNPPKATTTNFDFRLGLFLGHSVKNLNVTKDKNRFENILWRFGNK